MAAVVVALAAATGSAASAHDTLTASGHAAEDDVVLTPAQEREYTADTKRASQAVAAGPSGPPQQIGRWGPVQDLDVVGVHVALLPNGKVLAYDSVGNKATETYDVQDFTRAIVWDPATGQQQDVKYVGANIFCSGLAHLVDGSVFTAGGNKNSKLEGLNETNVFNPATGTWTRGQDMQADRWYPTVTALPDGRMLVVSGRNGGEGNPDIPEIRSTDGTIRALGGAEQELPQYPWLDVAPDGRPVMTGPDPGLQSIDVSGGGSWQPLANRPDGTRLSYGSHAVYDVGKILIAGGGEGGSATGSRKDALTVDVNGATPKLSPTSPMANARRQHNLTILADGSVLATGGNSSGANLVDLNAKAIVETPERWDPATGKWTQLADESVTRQYHSTALLLPDGRILSSGGGICGDCDKYGYLAKNAQVFTPPYLYDASGQLAPRPAITGAPSGVGYGATLDVGTPQAASIQKAGLVRLGAVTHSNNMDQRYIPLTFSRNGGGIQATAPANANIAPPGVYMLFLVDGQGVPSVAKMVSVGATPANAAPSATLTQPAAGAQPASFGLAAAAGDPDGSVAKVSFFADGRLVGEDTSAPYTAQVDGLAAGSHALTAVSTDGLGATGGGAQVVVTVGASNGLGSNLPGGPPGTISNSAPSSSVKLSRLVVLGSGKTRRLRLTSSATVRARITLARQRGTKLLTLKGSRSVTLRKGIVTLSVKDTWNSRRLPRGRYAVVVRAGGKTFRAYFTVR